MPTATALTGPTSAAQAQPLPASVKRSLADALVLDHPDAPWQPPDVLPPTDDLRRGVAIIEQQLAPADYGHIVYCVAKLISGFNERLTKDEAKLRARLWHEALPDVPADLWSAATIELLRSWKRDDHYGRVPEASDVLEMIRAQMERRRRDLDRVRRMLAQVNKPDRAAAPGPIRIPEAQRLRAILAEQRTRDGITEAQRLHVTAHTERALAFAERRAMEPWAREFFDAGIEQAPRPTMRRPTVDRSQWQAGAPVYAPEEPPMPDEIPEAL